MLCLFLQRASIRPYWTPFSFVKQVEPDSRVCSTTVIFLKLSHKSENEVAMGGAILLYQLIDLINFLPLKLK